jgi:tRNA U38,U39,U40 pseudouridine synthase TruA
MAQAATNCGIEPRSISFKGTVQTLAAFQAVIALRGHRNSTCRNILYQHLLQAIAVHQVADRPDRFEPRLRKRRPKHYAFLRKPRHEVKREMVKRFTTI